MTQFSQLPLFGQADNSTMDDTLSVNHLKDMGTFKDNMRAPIHSWFRYPAGYSYKFVHMLFQEIGIGVNDWVYDPFSGTGTTLLSAKEKGVNAYGVEAHSFVHWVADVKLNWDLDPNQLRKTLNHFLLNIQKEIQIKLGNVEIENTFPELVYKCYHTQDLKVLYLLRELIQNSNLDIQTLNLLKLALTDTLRNAALAGTGWPYISPKKNTNDKPPKDALKVFMNTVWKMVNDLVAVQNYPRDSQIKNVLGDSRQRQDLEDGQVMLALTSPPYLNNYDYADRTRLETYFWGLTNNWSDITRQYRDKLIVAATTQIIRSQYDVKTALSEEIRALAPEIYNTIQTAVLELAQVRLTKGGKKDYDLMVALYFNDILSVLKETYRVLKPGGHFCIIIGDSAPYGVPIQTDYLIGALGLAVGFRSMKYKQFRSRGDKWKDNPQRHNIKLQEGVVILIK